MSDLISYLVDRVAALAAKVEGIATRQWGVVTSADPLLVRLDGDPAPLVGTPDTLVGGLTVGDRVRVSIENRRPIILGRAGGPDIVKILGDTGWVWLRGPTVSRSGVRYRLQGTTMTVVADLGTETNLSITAGGVVVAALPEAYWPDEDMAEPASTKGASAGGQIRVGRDGKITCWSFGASSVYFAGVVRFPV